MFEASYPKNKYTKPKNKYTNTKTQTQKSKYTYPTSKIQRRQESVEVRCLRPQRLLQPTTGQSLLHCGSSTSCCFLVDRNTNTNTEEIQSKYKHKNTTGQTLLHCRSSTPCCCPKCCFHVKRGANKNKYKHKHK